MVYSVNSVIIADPEQFKNLDSNLKKNTAFIKKCRASLGQDALTQLKRDIKQLKLEKYVSEIVTAIPEGLQRCKREADVAAAVEVSIHLLLSIKRAQHN
jgi:regulator of nonsense transcripts 2